MSGAAALEFVFSGDAGPLGRPIALLSFLVDGSTYPLSPRPMLYTNSLLHGINALLLCGLWLAVLRQRGAEPNQAAWVAVGAALLWVFQPLLASGVLMAVQRMTILSSTFMLAGLWLYVLGREKLASAPRQGFVWMVLGLGGGTVLGVLTKEQAGLLPLLAWVLDACLLRRPQLLGTKAQRGWLGFKWVMFYLPAIAISAYLLRIVWHAESAYALREFDLGQRLWTQGVITWEYLRLGLLPRALAFGPYHDDYVAQGLTLTTGLAALAWLVVGLAAWLWRKRSPWPLFAFIWWWTAHAVESTVVPLELYFEHRNYLAIAGALLALVAGAYEWAAPRGRGRLVAGLLGIYGLLLASVLWQVTAIFGEPPVAAQLWAEQHPASNRAAQNLAASKVAQNDIPAALAVLDAAAQARPNLGAIALQGLQLACVLKAPHAELQARLDKVLHELPQAPSRFSVIDPLDKLKTMYQSKGCSEFLSQETLVSLTEAALASPQLSGHAQERSNLHMFLAAIYIDARNLPLTMQHLEAALQAVPSLQTMQLTAAVLKSAGLKQLALELMDEHPPKQPRNPWMRVRLEREWQELRGQLEAE